MQNLIQILIEISVFTSIMIILVLAIKSIAGRKISSKIMSLLWVLVLVRALLPITVESPIHMDSLFLKERIEVVEEAIQPSVNIVDEVPSEYAATEIPIINVGENNIIDKKTIKLKQKQRVP